MKNPTILLAALLNCIFLTFAYAQEECVPGEIIPGRFIVKHKNNVAAQSLSSKLLTSYRNAKLNKNNMRSDYSVQSSGGAIEIVTALAPVSASAISAMSASNASDFEYVIPDRVVCPLQNLKIKGKVRMQNASTPLFPATIAYYQSANNRGNFPSLTGSGALVSGGLFDLVPGLYTSPRKSVLFDLDNNGLADLLSNTSSKVFAWLSNGQGTFETRIDKPLGTGIEHFDFTALTDFDEDGSQDLLFSVGNKLYLQQFPDSALVNEFSEDIKYLADFDKDGDIDVLTLVRRDESTEEGFVGYTKYNIYSNSVGSFTLDKTFEIEEMDYDFQDDIRLFVTDFDNDGDNDLVSIYDVLGYRGFIAFHRFQNGTRQSAEYELLMNGSEEFEINEFLSDDLDGDGIKDFVASENNYDCLDNALGIWKGTGNVLSPNPNLNLKLGCLEHFTFEDYNADGKKDIIYVTEGRIKIIVNKSSPGSILFSPPSTLISDNKDDAHFFPFDPPAIGGALVQLSGPGGIIKYAYSNMRGEFEFDNLPAGNYAIDADRQGYSLLSEGAQSFALNSNKADANFGAVYLFPALSGYQASAGAPNDQGFQRMWGLENKGQNGGIPGVDIKAIQAWQITMGNPSNVIAILDNGTDYYHVDLIEKIWKNSGEVPANGIDDDGNGYTDDIYGIDAADNDSDPMGDNGNHGTHVAGTVGASVNNTIGIAGACPNCKLMPVKVFSSQSSGASDGNIIKGLDYVIRQKDRGVPLIAVNASLGGTSVCNQAYLDILSLMNQRDITFVAAAGNGGPDLIGDDNDTVPHTPSNCDVPNVIAVANISSEGNLSRSSNFGLLTVDVAAPGTDILSTYLNGFYESISGTSMAAPHVAGVVGLLKSHNPALTPAQIREILISTSTKMSQLQGKIVSGGIVNAVAALQSAGQTVIPPGAPGGPNAPAVPNSPNTGTTPNTGTPSAKISLANFSFTPKKIKSKGGNANFKASFNAATQPIDEVWVQLTTGSKSKKVKLKLQKSKKGIIEYKGASAFNPQKGKTSIKGSKTYQVLLFIKLKDGEVASYPGSEFTVGGK